MTEAKLRVQLLFKGLSIVTAATLLGTLATQAEVNQPVPIRGRVLAAGKGLPNAEVILMAANGRQKATSLGSTRTDGQGRFTLGLPSDANQQLYLLAHSGLISQLMLLGNRRPQRVVLNELGTIASSVTAAQFLQGDDLSGSPMALSIAANNVEHFVDTSSGTWGRTVIDANNGPHSTTLARLGTLGNLLALCGLPNRQDACRQLLTFDRSGMGSTLGVAQSLARRPWQGAGALFDLFDKAYPAPATANPEERRSEVTYLPYLSWSPEDFALSLKFSGGGVYSAGRISFAADGTMWSGQNWMPGSQAGAIRGIGGGLAALRPDGSPLSPAITGFTGMGIDGVGWGTAVGEEKVWLSSFSSTIGVFDLQGRPLGPAQGITLDGRIGQGQGIGIARNGDVWVADSTRDQLVHFPGGDHNRGRIVQVEGLKAPFGIAIDRSNKVWISNSRGNNVTVFAADEPAQAQQITVGVGVRGIAHDSRGNTWVASNMTPGFPAPRFPSGEIPIMKEFEVAYRNLAANSKQLPTGTIHMIPASDGASPRRAVLKQKAKQGSSLNVPWGLSIDGRDNVWVGNFLGTGLLQLCGADPRQCPEGRSSGDVIHTYVNGNTQSVTDVAIDPAGNVWYANNWNVLDAVAISDPPRRNSTKAGGDGVVVFYGLAAPVRTPLIGPVRRP